MSTLRRRYRSFKRITASDLEKLASLALTDLEDLFQRKTHLRKYRGRLLLICLCQGAAQHYVYGDRGIADFDLWAFFKKRANEFPPRRHGRKDFGISKFGRDPHTKFTGRRVDIMGRSIPVRHSETPRIAVKRYFSEPKAKSAKLLSEKPVVIVWPRRWLGKILWNPQPNELGGRRASRSRSAA